MQLMVHELGRPRRAGADGRVRPQPAHPPRRRRHAARRTARRAAVLDEPPRHRLRAAAGLHGARLQHRVAGRCLREHRAWPLRHPVPPRGRPHALRHRDPHPLPPRRRRLPREVVAGLRDRGAGERDPGAGRRRARDLRPLRRGRLGDRRAARPPRDRRPADLRLRRPRDDAQGRGRAGRHGLPRAARHPARPRRRGRPLPRPPRGSRRSRDEAQDHRRGVHPRLRGGGRRRSRTRASWSRARSTPT